MMYSEREEALLVFADSVVGGYHSIDLKDVRPLMAFPRESGFSSAVTPKDITFIYSHLLQIEQFAECFTGAPIIIGDFDRMTIVCHLLAGRAIFVVHPDDLGPPVAFSLGTPRTPEWLMSHGPYDAIGLHPFSWSSSRADLSRMHDRLMMELCKADPSGKRGWVVRRVILDHKTQQLKQRIYKRISGTQIAERRAMIRKRSPILLLDPVFSMRGTPWQSTHGFIPWIRISETW